MSIFILSSVFVFKWGALLVPSSSSWPHRVQANPVNPSNYPIIFHVTFCLDYMLRCPQFTRCSLVVIDVKTLKKLWFCQFWPKQGGVACHSSTVVCVCVCHSVQIKWKSGANQRGEELCCYFCGVPAWDQDTSLNGSDLASVEDGHKRWSGSGMRFLSQIRKVHLGLENWKSFTLANPSGTNAWTGAKIYSPCLIQNTFLYLKLRSAV